MDNEQEQSGGMTDKMNERMSQMGDKVTEQADMQKDRAAEGLEKTAGKMREQMGGGPAGQVGEKMAGSLEKTAGYLREHQTEEMWQDLEQFVKEHPIQAAVTAAVAGFVVARVLR